jgi:hypothetical protein
LFSVAALTPAINYSEFEGWASLAMCRHFWPACEHPFRSGLTAGKRRSSREIVQFYQGRLSAASQAKRRIDVAPGRSGRFHFMFF